MTLLEDQVSRAIAAATGRLDDTTRMFQELIGGASEEIERRVDGAAERFYGQVETSVSAATGSLATAIPQVLTDAGLAQLDALPQVECTVDDRQAEGRTATFRGALLAEDCRKCKTKTRRGFAQAAQPVTPHSELIPFHSAPLVRRFDSAPRFKQGVPNRG